MSPSKQASQDWDHPDPARRWRNRRYMAWVAFLAGVLYPFVGDLGFVSTDIAGPFYTFCGAVVCVYIGGAAYETVKLRTG